MGLKEMFELSALLRMQLPVLSSFAISRWLIGRMGAVLCAKFTLLSKASESANSCRHTLSVCGIALLLLALGHSLENARFPYGLGDPSSACQDYSNHKAQGYLCAASLLCLATSSASVDLGLSLAALKGVADMSVFTLVLAPAAWIRTYCNSTLFFTVVILLSLAYSALCYSDGSSRIGASVLSVCFVLLSLTVNALFACLMYVYRKAVGFVKAARVLSLKLVKRVSRREA